MPSSMNVMDSLAKLGIFPDRVLNGTLGNETMSGLPPAFMNTIMASAGLNASPLVQLILFVHRQMGMHLGIDPSLLLTLLGLLWGSQYFLARIYSYLEDLVERYLMCSITIGQDDSIYYHLMEWLSKQPKLNNNRYLMAQTVWRSAWEEDDDDDDDAGSSRDGLSWTDVGEGGDGRKYLNFSNQAARSSPRFVPAMGATRFWHNRVYFRLTRRKDTVVSGGWQAMKDKEEMKIYCYGRSIAPIKQLLREAKIVYYHDTHQKTTIYRPRQKENRREYHSLWQQVARRPVRPMDTVVLDVHEKHDVLSDINEYLHPTTPRWYASRGIPLRRGYLFHGPPGTGKTSFSFALAGVFGIDIYVISLQDASVTEEDLAALFTKLPRRCIVLLEDIDTAGLKRNNDDEDEEGEDAEEKTEAKTKENKGIEDVKDKKEMADQKEGKVKKDEEEVKVNGDNSTKTEKEKTKDDKKDDKKSKKKKKTKKNKSKSKDSDSDSDSSSESDSDSSDDDKKSKSKKKSKKKPTKRRRKDGKLVAPEAISLSGLLNAIDGVASHEGRVLILTTNKPESLDEALVRPGRVDRQVAFANATSAQAGELFHRMYETRWPHQQQVVSQGQTDKKKITSEEKKQQFPFALSDEDEKPVAADELKEIAAKFGDMVPEKTFSPAEIQGFLLKRKKSPRKALEEAPSWIEGTMKQKESKSMITTVQ